eukprot:CCRYP_001412-RA/>CCRYP_001412-RA protein AED:0.05 eAED:0.05 QI:110/1/1/1/0.5/0.4/5/2471/757
MAELTLRKRRPPEDPPLSPQPSRRLLRVSSSSVEVVHLSSEDDDDDEDEDDDEIEVVKIVKSKKQVHFDEVEHEVYYFKPYPVELVHDETLCSPNRSAVNSSKMTAEYTVLSSRHGRARRQLRNISKMDLRAAIKHGIKTPAHPNLLTGARRWKFTFKNVVYITDETCRQEITSYIEAMQIKPFPLTIPMMSRHEEVKRILKEEPHLCVGHTYIIIDQSGSMRNSDVNGFRDRSHAAYGTLALDFIAEQLSSRPNREDLFAESVTVVEMRNEGEIVHDRQPFDWILFNRLVRRPDISRPFSHGNYNKSLCLVRDLIIKEYNSLVESGAEEHELPKFNVVFLSDGKPSDDTRVFDQQRVDILSSLTAPLQSKFSLYAMGVGAKEADFTALANMVDTVKNTGGTGQFVHAGLSAVTMSTSFSAISSALTSARTELLTGKNDASPKTHVKKDFTMRETGKIVGKVFPIEKFINGKGYTVKRFRFDKDLNERGQSPWKDVGFAAHGANGFEMEIRPLGEGAERLAYRFNEIKYDKTKVVKKVGKLMVAKKSIRANEKETKEDFHKDFCRVQNVAYDLAEKFNHAVRQATPLKAVSGETRPPELKFVLCHVYTYTNHETKEDTGVLVERFLPGKFTKYNSNNGYVREANSGVHNTRTIELMSGKVRLEEFVQAFSHWVYVHTNHTMVVCDLQGVLNEEGRYPEFLLTDPAICTRKPPRYGKTDMKLSGIRNFCSTHRCGLVCRGLGLPCITSSLANNDKKKS